LKVHNMLYFTYFSHLAEQCQINEWTCSCKSIILFTLMPFTLLHEHVHAITWDFSSSYLSRNLMHMCLQKRDTVHQLTSTVSRYCMSILFILRKHTVFNENQDILWYQCCRSFVKAICFSHFSGDNIPLRL
jgi:hypothetical protein